MRKCGWGSSWRVFSSSSSSSSSSHSKIPLHKVLIRDVNEDMKHMHYAHLTHDLSSSAFTKKPIVIIGGTAQTIHTFEQHLKYLSRHRRVYYFELRGQGKTTDLTTDVKLSMELYCNDLSLALEALHLHSCDMVGFSFGGRVCLTMAALFPQYVSRLSVSGVPLHRPVAGTAILNEWADLIGQGKYMECGRSMLMSGYSPAFLEKNGNFTQQKHDSLGVGHKDKLEPLIKMIVNNNNMKNVQQLILNSHPSQEDNTYSIPACVQRISCPTQVIAGTHDRIAGFEEVKDLHRLIKHSQFNAMDSGHLIPFQDPGLWRKLVVDFFDSEQLHHNNHNNNNNSHHHHHHHHHHKH